MLLNLGAELAAGVEGLPSEVVVEIECKKVVADALLVQVVTVFVKVVVAVAVSTKAAAEEADNNEVVSEVDVVFILLIACPNDEGRTIACLPPTEAALYMIFELALMFLADRALAKEGLIIRMLETPVPDLEAESKCIFCGSRDLDPATDVISGDDFGMLSNGSVLITTPGGRGYFFSSFLRLAARSSGDISWSELHFR